MNARVPKRLYDWVCSEYDNTSLAINEGLEILQKSKTGEVHFDTDNLRQNDIPEHTSPDEDVSQERKARVRRPENSGPGPLTSCIQRMSSSKN